MNPRLRISALRTFGRAWKHYHLAAYGAGLIFALASGTALGFSVIVERLTTTDVEARAVSAAARPPPLSMAAVRVADRSYNQPMAISRVRLAHVVDRWHEEPVPAATRRSRMADRGHDGATGLPLASGRSDMITTSLARGGFQSVVAIDDLAANELRLFGP